MYVPWDVLRPTSYVSKRKAYREWERIQNESFQRLHGGDMLLVSVISIHVYGDNEIR